jgi:hypothetical protein
VVFHYRGIDQFDAMRPHPGKRPPLVGFHKPRIARHISGQYCRQPAFHALSFVEEFTGKRQVKAKLFVLVETCAPARPK